MFVLSLRIKDRTEHLYKGLFIIDGIITIPIGLLGFFIMPGKRYRYLLLHP